MRSVGRPPNTVSTFWSRVDKTDGCWLWTSTVVWNGYGQFRINNRRVYAHRFAYEQVVGPVPDRLDHLCRNRRCVNPAHLEPVTRQENLRRGAGSGGVLAETS